MQAEGDPVVFSEGLALGYGGITAVKDATFAAYRGRNLVIGPNGSGKTTLLKAMAGLLKPLKGTIRVLGLNPYRDLGRLVSRLLYVPEGDPYPDNVMVSDVVSAMEELYGSSEAREAVELLGLERFIGKRVKELSQGMRRRLVLAEAIASRRELLLLDEPYRGLDKGSRGLVSEALEELASKGSTLIMTSHIMPRFDVDHVIVVEDGSVTYAGAPDKERILCIVIEC